LKKKKMRRFNVKAMIMYIKFLLAKVDILDIRYEVNLTRKFNIFLRNYAF